MKRKNYAKEDYESVKLYFKYNKNQHISGRELEELFSITTSQNQAIIHDLRVNEVPIISCGNKGYKYTTNMDEITRTYMSLCGRGMSILVAANGLKGYLEN